MTPLASSAYDVRTEKTLSRAEREREVRRLMMLFAEIAQEDTAWDGKPYTGGLCGHSGIIARYLQERYGGVLLSAHFHGYRHFWNCLPGNWEVDATQFDGQSVRQGRVSRPSQAKNPRYDRFVQRLNKRLEQEAIK